MIGRSLALTASVALALTGCAHFEYFRGSAACEADIEAGYCEAGGTKCTVTVAVPDFCAPDRIVTTPPLLHVCKNNTRITWVMKPGMGYQFAPADGVDFKGHKEFDEKSNPDPYTYVWTDKHTKSDSNPIKYDLNIQKDNGGPCAKVDPFIYND